MAKVVSIIILILLGPLYFLTFFNFALNTTLYNPDFIKKEFAEKKLYTTVLTKLPELFPVEGNTSDSTEGLNNEDIVKIIQSNLSPADFQLVSEFGIDLMMGNASSPTQNQKQIIEKLKSAFEAKYNSLPICSEDLLENCKQSDVSFDQMISEMSGLSQLGIPMNEILSGSQTASSASTSATSQAGPAAFKMPNLSLGKYIGYIFAIVLGVILILLARLFAGKWKRILAPLGGYMLFVAGMSFISGFVFMKLVVSNIVKMIPQVGSATFNKELLNPIINDAVNKINVSFNNILLWFSIIAVIFLIIGIILNLVIKEKPKEINPQPVSSKTK